MAKMTVKERLAALSKPNPPTERQLEFAETISDDLDIPLPDGIEEDWRIAKKFLDEYVDEWRDYKASLGDAFHEW